ncbi:MAG: precorrin-6A reductase [Lachnospiraceae bacterium]|nr:precorrin-6A reductase [Lachnospiraceae bacterium]
MKHYLIFAGTTEGRKLTEYLMNKDVLLTVCVATEYGKILLPSHPNLTVHTKPMDAEEMYLYMKAQVFDAVLDATHPYALIASKNIKLASKRASLPYYRILRPKEEWQTSEHVVYVKSMEAAAKYLSTTTGNILATTGSKELKKLTVIPDYQNRIFARILPNPQMVSDSFSLGFQGKHLICMQGPFSEELNTAMIYQFHISYLLTKNSGKIGGFLEKAESARKTGITLVVIGLQQEETEGYSLEEIIELLENAI